MFHRRRPFFSPTSELLLDTTLVCVAITTCRMDAPEVFAIIGFPARLAGRVPLLLRYIWGANANVFSLSGYAIERWGPSARFRPWLLLDAGDLEPIERLINEGTDEEVLNFRGAQLAIGSSTAVVVRIGIALYRLKLMTRHREVY